ncbi:MAG: endonuclease/exonuclease/phosphatase family protein [Anaerolineales bacterium]|nr:endonuclease/exonuclease/phosphatase family protein [Anaerolineales bacterium]
MTTFTVMTWNVENLFPPGEDADDSDHLTYAFKLNLLAEVILEADPDVVALQEVGSQEAMQDLQIALSQSYPHMATSAFPDGRGIRVAFLSRLEITDRQDIVNFPPGPAAQVFNIDTNGQPIALTRMGRGALQITIRKDALAVTLITAHLKSKLLTFKTASGKSSFSPTDENQRAQAAGIALHRRTAEALTLRTHFNALLENNANTPLILLGDLNDVPEAQTTLLLLGPPGSELGTRGFNRPDKGDDARLFNLAARIDEERRYSRVHHGREELLDQILVSEELFPRDKEGNRILPHVDSLVDFIDRLPSISDNPNIRKDEVPPDHAPVVARFEL